jgi:aryl-alcohol dehydrogenase-like predicted oxidoreductase
MTFGENEGQPTLGGLTQQDASALVAKAFEAGVNLFDTADVYALGDSEHFLGEALRNLGVPRESYLIATKAFGPMPGPRRQPNLDLSLTDGAGDPCRPVSASLCVWL